MAGATASCRLCSSLDRGFLQANLIPSTSPSSLCPTPGQLFFLVCGIQSSVSHASHPRPQGALPSSYQRCPVRPGLIREVKQTRYYGMEPSLVAGSPGSLGTEPERGSQDGVELGTEGGVKARATLLLMSADGPRERELGRGRWGGKRPVTVTRGGERER